MKQEKSCGEREMITRRIERVIFDLHGVLLHPDARLAAGLSPSEVVKLLRQKGYQVGFVSNSSTMSRNRMVEILGALGIKAKLTEVASAGLAVALYLKCSFPRFRLLLIGQEPFREIVELVCRRSISADAEREAVVVGRDPQLTSSKLAMAAEAAKRGAVLVATSRDAWFRMNSQLCVGPGETVRQVEQVMGIAAKIIGKPNPFILEDVLGLSNEQMKTTLLVGDEVDCDVEFGNVTGAKTALLALRCPRRGPRPDFVIQRLDQVLSLVEIAR